MAVMQSLLFAGDERLLKSSLRNLASKDWDYITSRPLFGKTKYFQLSARGARTLGEPEESALPFGPQALARLFATLNYCCLASPEKKKIKRGEFTLRFPDLVAQGVPYNDYVLDTDGDSIRLERLIVDLGGDAERLARKILRIARDLRESPKALSMLMSNSFGFTILTNSDSKAEALRRATADICEGIQIQVSVVPGLINVLPDFYA